MSETITETFRINIVNFTFGSFGGKQPSAKKVENTSLIVFAVNDLK